MPAPSGLNRVATTGSSAVGNRAAASSRGRGTGARRSRPTARARLSTGMKPYMSRMPWRAQRRYIADGARGRTRRTTGRPRRRRGRPTRTPHRSAARAPTRSTTPTDSWPGTKAKPGGQGAGVLLVVGAAEPARLDAQQPVVVADLGESELARLELARRGENERGRARAHTVAWTPASRAVSSRATSGQGAVRSAASATSNSSASSWWRPSTCMPTGQLIDEAGRDRHRRVAVHVGDDRERAHVDEIGEPLASRARGSTPAGSGTPTPTTRTDASAPRTAKRPTGPVSLASR